MIRKIVRMRALAEDLRGQGRKVALVPTMGGKIINLKSSIH